MLSVEQEPTMRRHRLACHLETRTLMLSNIQTEASTCLGVVELLLDQKKVRPIHLLYTTIRRLSIEPSSSVDYFSGCKQCVWIKGVVDAATAVKTVDEIQRELDSLLQASSQRENAESQDGNVSGSPERKGQHKLRMWSKDQNGGWNESLGNLDRAGDRLRTASLGSVGTSDSAVGHQYTSSASAGSAKRRGRKSQSTVFHQYTSALKVADEQHPPAPSEISRAQPTDAIQVIMV